MESTHTASIDIPELSRAAYIAHFSLVWRNTNYCKLANFVTKATPLHLRLTRSQFTTPAGVEVLRGAPDLNTGLWQINLRHEHQQHSAGVENKVYELLKTGELVKYLHKEIFSPTK
jgi:hypothetical protein